MPTGNGLPDFMIADDRAMNAVRGLRGVGQIDRGSKIEIQETRVGTERLASRKRRATAAPRGAP